MVKRKQKLFQFGTVLGVGILMGVLAGCSKTQEVVPPQSTLETSLQTPVTPTLGVGVTETPKPWPTTGGATPVGQPVTPMVTLSASASSQGLTTQPQTGVGTLSLVVVVAMVGLGSALLASGLARDKRR